MKKILVVDDEKDILDVVEYLLLSENFEVRSLSSSTYVVETARDFDPDLFLIDYLLPQGNGADLCRQLKAEDQFKKTPVILFSALPRHQIKFSESDCDELLTKPFDVDVLLEMVKRLTSSS